MNLAQLKARGFDRSEHTPFTKQYRVRCGQCEALVINGTPTHETGCPNQTHACAGCNEIIPSNQKYCQECK